MSQDKTQTPKFRKPPLVETALGCQFESLASMKIVHFGLFWKMINVADRFPQVEEQAPLPPEIEAKVLQPLQLSFLFKEGVELPRVWFLTKPSERGQELLQLQNDRFLQNWRRKSLTDEHYPSFDTNHKEFQADFALFCKFIQEHKLGDLRITQCEVTYVNRIVVDEGSTPGQMAAFTLPFLSEGKRIKAFPGGVESISYASSFWIDEIQGRMRIQAGTAFEKESGQSVVDLRLTARGSPKSPDPEKVSDWLKLGHDFVVNGFADMTNPELHKKWERIR